MVVVFPASMCAMIPMLRYMGIVTLRFGEEEAKSRSMSWAWTTFKMRADCCWICLSVVLFLVRFVSKIWRNKHDSCEKKNNNRNKNS